MIELPAFNTGLFSVILFGIEMQLVAVLLMFQRIDQKLDEMLKERHESTVTPTQD